MESDVVVIGAGHNGLTLATYLRRSGLSVVVVDGHPFVGGLSRSETPALPGFRHQPHANFLNYHTITPMMAAFGLERYGMRALVPEVQHAIAFADGSPAIVLHRDDHMDRTRASIARYSRKDADTFLALRKRARKLGPALARAMYRPPGESTLAEHLDAVSQAYAGLDLCKGLGGRSARSVIDSLFESPQMRTILYLLTSEFGVDLEEHGGDVAFLGVVLWMICARTLPVGGMQTVADAMAAGARAAGVDIRLGQPAAKIIVTDGRARAVVLNDGRRIPVRAAVASTAGLRQTLLELVGAEHLSHRELREIQSYRRAVSTMTSQHFCLREAPTYRSGRIEPDLNLSAHTFIGFDTPEDVVENLQAVAAGHLPPPGGSVHVNTINDPGQGPAGKSAAGVNTLFPSAETLTESEKARIADSYNDALLKTWRRYAANMTRENVLADHFSPFEESDRTILLRPGREQYRTSVDGLYLCGSSTYPGGGVHGACGYNAFGVISADLARRQD